MDKSVKPMTMGQKALYEIAVDAERCKQFLINLAVLKSDARRRTYYALLFSALSFLVGYLIGSW